MVSRSWSAMSLRDVRPADIARAPARLQGRPLAADRSTAGAVKPSALAACASAAAFGLAGRLRPWASAAASAWRRPWRLRLGGRGLRPWPWRLGRRLGRRRLRPSRGRFGRLGLRPWPAFGWPWLRRPRAVAVALRQVVLGQQLFLGHRLVGDLGPAERSGRPPSPRRAARAAGPGRWGSGAAGRTSAGPGRHSAWPPARMASPSSCSVTVTLSRRPISARTRPSRTRRSAILRYSALQLVFATCPRPPAPGSPSSSSASTWRQMPSNSASTMRGGSGKSWPVSSASSRARFSLKREAPAYSLSRLALQRVLQRRRGRPCRAARRGRRRPAPRPGPRTSLTLTSNSAAWPFRRST